MGEKAGLAQTPIMTLFLQANKSAKRSGGGLAGFETLAHNRFK
jgi:hypothetical protein